MTTTDIPQPTPLSPTAPPQGQPARRKLSELLAGIPENELHVIVDTYEEHVLKGTIRALPLRGETFGLSYQGKDAKVLKRTLNEEIVEDNEAFRTWLARSREAARLALLRLTGRVETTVSRLESGADNFETLLEIRRHRMRQKTGGTEAVGAPRPTKKGGATAPSPDTDKQV